MAKRRVMQGAAQPIVIYDPAQKKFLEGSAIPIVLFDANGVHLYYGDAEKLAAGV